MFKMSCYNRVFFYIFPWLTQDIIFFPEMFTKETFMKTSVRAKELLHLLMAIYMKETL